MARGLTPKQEKFVLGLIEGKSQRQAYRAAYDCKNMSDKVADTKASVLLKQDKVWVRYSELRDRLTQEAEDEAIITAKDVLKEIANIAKDDISNYLDFYPNSKALSGIGVDIKDSRSINTKNVSEVSVGANGQFKFKLYSRDAALYKLAEILGITRDDLLNYEGDGNTDDLTAEELKVLAAKIMSERGAEK